MTAPVAQEAVKFGPGDGRGLERRSDLAVALALAGFLAAVYLLTYSGVPHSPDEWFYLAGAHAAVTGDWTALQAHGRLFTLLLTPFYAVSAAAPGGMAGPGAFQSAALAGSVIAAATGALLYVFLGEFGLSRRLRLATALLFGLATLSWPYSHYLFREPAAGLALLGAVYGVVRWARVPVGRWALVPLLTGAFAFACGVAIKGTLLAFAPFLVVGAAAGGVRRLGPERGRQAAPWVAIGGSVLIFATLAILRLPVFAGLVPAYALGTPDLGAFVALWISPGWGLLLFSPVLVLSFFGVVPFTRQAPETAFVALGGSVFYVLLSTTNPFWWGYWAFGPRQLVVLLPLLCLPLPFGLQWLRERWGRAGLAFAAVIAGLSLLVQLLGVLSPFNQYVRDVLFPAGLTGPALTWRWDAWTLPGLLRYLEAGRVDIAWLISGPGGGARWAVLAGLVLCTAAAGAWLWALSRGRADGRQPGASAVWVSAAVCLVWVPVALLAVRSVWADPRYQPDLGYPAAAAIVRAEAGPDDVLVTDLWTQDLNVPAVAMLNYCRAGCPRRIDLPREDLLTREVDWQQQHLVDLAGRRRAWLVLTRVAPGDPNSIVEQWLGQAGYLERCDWTGPQVRLCRYALPAPASGHAVVSGGANAALFGDRIRLRRSDVQETPAGTAEAKAPDALLVDLTWEALVAPGADYVASLQLLGPDRAGGGVRSLASVDIPLGNGFKPASGWQGGDVVQERRSLSVPRGLAPGAYQLLLVLYDPATGKRLEVRDRTGGTTGGDALTLMDFTVTP